MERELCGFVVREFVDSCLRVFTNSAGYYMALVDVWMQWYREIGHWPLVTELA